MFITYFILWISHLLAMDALSIGYDGTDGTKAGALLSCAGALHWGMQLANLGVPKRSDYMGRVPQISPDITRRYHQKFGTWSFWAKMLGDCRQVCIICAASVALRCIPQMKILWKNLLKYRGIT